MQHGTGYSSMLKLDNRIFLLKMMYRNSEPRLKHDLRNDNC